MNAVSQRMVSVLKSGLVAACLAMGIFWPQWRVALQEQDYPLNPGSPPFCSQICNSSSSCGTRCTASCRMPNPPTVICVEVDCGEFGVCSSPGPDPLPPGPDPQPPGPDPQPPGPDPQPPGPDPQPPGPGPQPPDLNPDPPKNLGSNTTDQNSSNCQEGQTSGDPINNTTGNLFQIETDYVGAGAFPLVFERIYNSQSSSLGAPTMFGMNWSHSYSGRIHHVPNSAFARVIKSDQKILTFEVAPRGWQSTADVNSTLEMLTANGGTTGWRYTTGSDDVEIYDASGKLLSITTRAGLTHTLHYDGQGRLEAVSDPFGRTLTFAYDASNRVQVVTDPGNGTYIYAYDAQGRLSSVTGPDQKTRDYHYEDAAFPHALTGVTDENRDRFATWTYNAQGLVQTSELAGGVNEVSVNYDFSIDTTTVTDALGTSRSYAYGVTFGVARTAQANKPKLNGGTATSFWFYDDRGNIETYIDYRGNRTTFRYDSRNLETERIEAFGTAQERFISTQWHPTFRLPTRLAEPLRITSYEYDDGGTITCGARSALCRVTIQETTDATGSQRFTATRTGKARAWSYTYNSNGQVATVDGPRIDALDVTQYDYDDNGDTIKSETNALGHITQFRNYDPHGRPQEIEDPNGLVVILAYDLRGRLETVRVGGELTIYKYDGVGQLERITRPDGTFIHFDYDAAHRLETITDSLGNRITYTLDAVGNITKEEVKDPRGILTRTLSRAPDALNRLARIEGALQQTTSFEYDDNDNLIKITDPLTRSTSPWVYDKLDRLETSSDLNRAETGYKYNSNNRLISVIDPLLHETTYDYDGLENQTSTRSPDTGLTEYIPDEAGNIVSRKEPRGKQITYRYDELDRLTHVDFSDGRIAFVYDQEPNGIGRLTQMIDPSGSTRWLYDRHGRVVRKTQQVGNLTLVMQYHYDPSGRLDSITYPSGQLVEFSYTDGQITEISANKAALLRDIQYQPFGPPRAWVWGDGTLHSRQFDLDGRVETYDLGGGRTRRLIYDHAGRITDYVHNDPSHDQTFDYDAAGALTSFTSRGTSTMYELDRNGNRESVTGPQGVDDYIYDPASNRLVSIVGMHGKAYSYDDDGNVISDGTNRFTYDGRGRLVEVANAQGATQYLVNGLGQRVAKLGGTHFVYDEAGQLIGEYTQGGQPIQETVYLGDMPVGVLKNRTRFFVYSDHLGAPRAIADTSSKVVWRWEGDPFGEARPNEDPDRDGRTFSYNLRLPGQRFDRETGLSYNYFRDYDPQTGRYIQADPIGLAGGLNPYSYAEGNPLSYYDPYGLSPGNCAGSTGTQRNPFDRAPPGALTNPDGSPVYFADALKAAVRFGQNVLRYGRNITRSDAMKQILKGEDVVIDRSKAALKLGKDLSPVGKATIEGPHRPGQLRHVHPLDEKGRHLEGTGHIFIDKALQLAPLFDFNDDGTLNSDDVLELLLPPNMTTKPNII